MKTNIDEPCAGNLQARFFRGSCSNKTQTRGVKLQLLPNTNIEKKDNVKETSDQSTKYLNGKPIDTSIAGKTPLHLAAEKGNLYLTARLLLSEGADLNAQDEGGWTPLHYAASSGNIGVVKLLVDKGADLSITDYHHKEGTPMFYAFQNGHTNMSNIIEKYLVDKDRADTPLHLAVEEGNLETVKHLIEKGAGINAVNRYGYTPLYIAAYKGSTDIAVYLVEKGANVSDNILHKASNLDIVKYFIAKGANINATEENGETFLHIAAIDGKLEIVQYLVEEKNFNINAANIKGNTVLHHAAHGGCERTARYLVEKGANMEATNRHGITPLHIAAFCGYSYVVENLIEDGADKNAISSNGCTLAHYAAIGDESGMSCVLEYLVEEEGVNFNATDNLGSTPLHWAAYWNNSEVVEYLVEKRNVDINVTDNEGRTPLHWAAYHANIDLVKYFIERGAEIKATKKYGNTPLHYAINGRWNDDYLEVVEYIAGTRKLTIPKNVENVEKDSLDIIKYDFY